MLARHEVTLNHFRNLLEVLYHLIVLAGLGKGDTHKGTDVESQSLGLYEKAGASDDAHSLHLLDPLMYGRSGYSAFAGYLKEWHPGIFY